MTNFAPLRAEAIAHGTERMYIHAPLLVALVDELTALRSGVKPPKPARNAYPSDFEAVWNAYPVERRGSKIASHRAWLARVNSGIDPRTMAYGLTNYLQHAKQTGKEVAYLYLLQTFFGPDEHFNSNWNVTAAIRKGGGGGAIDGQDYSAGVAPDGSF